MKQTTAHLLMVEPCNFGFNLETASNNYFQQKLNLPPIEIQEKALAEFSAMVDLLSKNGIDVMVLKDTTEPFTPDSVFPNNWFSTHANGTFVLYPMFAPNRRMERREDVLGFLEKYGFSIDSVLDFTQAEQETVFLEGTGSIILDRQNQWAFAAISPRTDEALFIEFCEELEYSPVIFTANQTVDGIRKPIYHTNVMMAIADKYAVVCLDTIDDKKEKINVVKHLRSVGKEIISITENQMQHFAGNMLQVENTNGEKFLVMSKTAYDSLTENQIEKITQYNPILAPDVSTIEQIGGGSVRCMMAEIFLPES